MMRVALLTLTAGYVVSLYVLASLVDRSTGRVRKLARHPLVHALALGVFTTSWNFFGQIRVLAQEGSRFYAGYVGATISCALLPWIWVPVARLCRAHALSSVADVLAFRYDSRATGIFVTLFFLAGSLPYQALQLRAAARSVTILSNAGSEGTVAIVITALLVGFALAYGIRHLSPESRHDGFVAALAVESLVKLIALLAVAGYVVFSIFGGFHGLDTWLVAHPEALAAVTGPARERPWFAGLFLFGVSVFLLPRQFFIAFNEGSLRGLRTASWVLPLYLLAMSFSVPLLLWASKLRAPGGPTEFYLLSLCQQSGSTALSAIVFLGALSASGAMIVSTTVALAGMLQHNLIAPLIAGGHGDLHQRLKWLRRGLVVGIILAGHGVYVLVGNGLLLYQLGFASLVAVAQVVPAFVGTFLWSRGTARGAMLGLIAGSAAWVVSTVVPLLAQAGVLPANWNWPAYIISAEADSWSFITAFTLAINCMAYVFGSLWRDSTQKERRAFALCQGKSEFVPDQTVQVASAREFIALLAPALGESAARREIEIALAQLGLSQAETRPDRLVSLRQQLEKNLSALVGPVTARIIVDQQIVMALNLRRLLSQQLSHVEDQLRANLLDGTAKEIDTARQSLRNVLEQLPVGVCVLGPDRDVAVWNRAMVHITGLDAQTVSGLRVDELPACWRETLASFATDEAMSSEVAVDSGSGKQVLVLHRASVALSGNADGFVILVEDRTEESRLRSQVEQVSRVNLIGNNTSNIAHEIQTPLATIGMLAQELKAELEAPELQERLNDLLLMAARAERSAQLVLDFVRAGESAQLQDKPVEQVSVAELVSNAIRVATLARGARAPEIVRHVDSRLTLRGHQERLEEVLVNLLNNALDACPNGQSVAVEALRAGNSVCIRVVDEGQGMSEAVCNRVFERHFTTKDRHRGTGLGLSIAQKIIQEHRGAMSIDSAPGRGTTVTLELPS